jgi:hypothetical protein
MRTLRVLVLLRFRPFLSKQVTLLAKETFPARCGNVFARETNKGYYVSTFREPLAVVAQAFLIPEQGQSWVGIQSQSLDITAIPVDAKRSTLSSQRLSAKARGSFRKIAHS